VPAYPSSTYSKNLKIETVDSRLKPDAAYALVTRRIGRRLRWFSPWAFPIWTQDKDFFSASGVKVFLTGESVQVDLFGLPLPIISNNNTGAGGRTGPYSVSDFSRIARIVGASGSAGAGVCAGSIKITVST